MILGLWLAGCGHGLASLLGLPRALPLGSPSDCAAFGARVDGGRAFAAIEHLALAPRRSAAQRSEVRAWATEALREEGWATEERPFHLSGVEGVNLLARGSSGARVLVGAHYDTVTGSPGADDNASGVAVVLEIARALGPAAPVDVALFDAEEPHDAAVGTDGRNFAFGSQALVDGGVDYDIVFVVESVGYRCEREGCQQLPPGLPGGIVPADGSAVYWIFNGDAEPESRWPDLAATAAAADPTGVIPVSIPNRGGSIRQARFSDHAPFWDAGIDAVMITDTALLRNPGYHRASDGADALDPSFVASVARGTAAAVASAAGMCPVAP